MTIENILKDQIDYHYNNGGLVDLERLLILQNQINISIEIDEKTKLRLCNHIAFSLKILAPNYVRRIEQFNNFV